MEELINNTTGEKAFLAETTVYDKLSQRSEMAQEILSRKPNFMEKWALFIFMGILLILLAATWFIRYPDYIQTRATLTATNAPKEIIPRHDGRLVKLFFHNNGQVKKNEVFGWLESTSNHEEVLGLSQKLDSCINLLNSGQGQKVSRLFNGQYNNLGEIQQQYQSFITVLQQFNDYVVNGFYSRQKGMLENDLRYLESTNKTILDQKKLTEQDVKLAGESYSMNKKLLDEKILSKEEFRQVESKFLNKQMAIPQLDAALLSNKTQGRSKLREIDQLEHDMAQQQVIFRQALQSLKSSVDDWKLKYVLQSPIDGHLSFIIRLQENQFLQAGRLIGYVSPADARFYSEVYLPQGNFGKIDTGLHVQLRFDAYPYQEVGFVEGSLDYISSIATDSGFLATIKLKNGLVTNNHTPIAYRSGLKAEAIVITREMRLLQRFWYTITKSAHAGSK
jgi:HlyD family secretion protein